MYVTWGFLVFFQVFSGRYLRFLYKIRMWMHRIIGAIVLIVTVFFATYIWLNFYTLSVAGIGRYHKPLGTLIFIWIFVQVAGGVLNRIVMRRLKAKRYMGIYLFCSK